MIPEFETVLVVTIRDQTPACYPVCGDQFQIGRGGNNHLTLDDPAVSHIHCEFINDTRSGQWIFRDLGSTNGSKLNGHPVDWDARSVKDGDEIVLGDAIKLLYLRVREIENPESLKEDEEDFDVNPVAAAIARQGREDLESTQLIRIKPGSRSK